MPAVESGPLDVSEVVLFQSDLGRDGSRYTPLARLPLAAETLPLPIPSQQGERSNGQEH